MSEGELKGLMKRMRLGSTLCSLQMAVKELMKESTA